MPTLKRYAESSKKSGFYILANVGGAHPVTLQVTPLGKQILKKAGYSDGDSVPTKVVWAMFDVGILFTSGSINNIPEVAGETDEIFQSLNVTSNLSAAELRKLLEYLRQYTGPNRSQVEALVCV